MSRVHLTRRGLLRSLGAAGLALGTSAPGIGGSDPLRVVFYVSSHGTVYDAWRLRPPGADEGDDWQARLSDGPLSPILEPLRRHVSRLLVLDGIGNAAAMCAGYNEHRAGNASCQTGRVPIEVAAERSVVDGPSVDQAIAAIRDTPFPSLEYTVGQAEVAYDASGRALPSDNDPVEAWWRLFPSADPSERTRQLQGRVLQLAAERFEALSPRLSGGASQRLDEHGQQLESLMRRQELLARISCAPPPRPSPPPGTSDADYPGHQIDAFSEILVTALACGLTQVGTIRVDHIPPATIGAPPGNLHADIAHAVATDPQAADYMIAHHAWHASQVAALLDRLEAVPVGSGSLLDQTLVVWHNEMGTGDHWFSRVPVVLAGGGGILRTDQVIYWADRHEVQGLWFPQPLAVPHQRLLATIGVAAGLSLDSFGDQSLPDHRGEAIDCTGTLDRVWA